MTISIVVMLSEARHMAKLSKLYNFNMYSLLYNNDAFIKLYYVKFY